MDACNHHCVHTYWIVASCDECEECLDCGKGAVDDLDEED